MGIGHWAWGMGDGEIRGQGEKVRSYKTLCSRSILLPYCFTLPNYQLPIPNYQLPIPNAQCPIPHAPFPFFVVPSTLAQFTILYLQY
ncbi:MAG: hypothetical protein AAF630_09080 [Cyanobacteria bacterium P01_C01_bin.38]